MHPMFVKLYLEPEADDLLADEQEKRRSAKVARRHRSRMAVRVTTPAPDRRPRRGHLEHRRWRRTHPRGPGGGPPGRARLVRRARLRPPGPRWEIYGPHRDDPADLWTEVYWRLA